MKLFVNGEAREMPDKTRLTELIKSTVNEKLPFAIAVNGDFVARSDYENICLNETDEIDIVSPVGGG